MSKKAIKKSESAHFKRTRAARVRKDRETKKWSR